MSLDRLRTLVEPLLEALAERVYWAPVIFLPGAQGGPTLTCGSTPKDVDQAHEVVSEGRALDESALVAVDRWVRVFRVVHDDVCYGHVALLARVPGSNVPALSRLVGVLASVLAAETAATADHVRRREVEASQAELSARVRSFDVDRRFHTELHAEMSTGDWREAGGHIGSLQRIVGCLARHLGAPVVLQGRNLVLLAEAGAEAATVALAPGRHQSLRDVVGPLARSQAIVELPAAGVSPRRLVAPIWGAGELLGFLTTAPSDGEGVAVERSLECTAGFVAMERVIRSELEEAHQLDREVLLRDLFSGTSLHRLTARGLRMDLDLRRPYVPCAFVPTGGAQCTPIQLRSVVIDALREVTGGSTEALAAVFEDQVVALVPEEIHLGLGGLCERIVKYAEQQGWQVRGGVGPVCRELADYEAAVRKARWVVDALESMEGQDWAQFEDFGIYAILFDRERSTQLEEFVQRQLGALVAYDEVHRTDLVETLRCVLDTGAVLTEAAKQLYIHISTLKYRVNRIEDLLGVELRNAQTAFDLHLACKILVVRKQLGGGESALNGPAEAVTEPAPARKRPKAVPPEDRAVGT